MCLWCFYCYLIANLSKTITISYFSRELKISVELHQYGWSSTRSFQRQCIDFLVLCCEENHETKYLLGNYVLEKMTVYLVLLVYSVFWVHWPLNEKEAFSLAC